MKACFIHDFPVFEIDNEVYTFGTFKHFHRYLTHIDELNIICRKKNPPSGEYKKFEKNNIKNININAIENYSNIQNLNKRKSSIKKMESVIKNSDFIIIRLPSILGIDAYKYVKKYNKPYLGSSTLDWTTPMREAIVKSKK